ncbi:MAG: (2Fe-2S)-binding protein [Candidatus Latescibacterota bacterium]|nr:MAG: (2Fe-2S)-binding protein [Candidatus Latescibacterota bacterium]
MTKTVLCHCEDVEIDELYSAVKQGYGDIETLKRYTGIGTGKCQGKCCLVQTLRILASLDTPAERKTAGGDASELMGDPRKIRLPTIRPPLLPMRIDDILEENGERR